MWKAVEIDSPEEECVAEEGKARDLYIRENPIFYGDDIRLVRLMYSAMRQPGRAVLYSASRETGSW